ncbi:MAG: hypothetical protein QXR56_07950 [Thermofilaceae archaeon]
MSQRMSGASSGTMRTVRVDDEVVVDALTLAVQGLFPFGDGILTVWTLGNVLPGGFLSFYDGDHISLELGDPKTGRLLMEIDLSFTESGPRVVAKALQGALSDSDVNAVIDEVLNATYTVYHEILAYAAENPHVAILRDEIEEYARTLSRHGARVHPRIALHARPLIRELTAYKPSYADKYHLIPLRGELRYLKFSKTTWVKDKGVFCGPRCAEYEFELRQSPDFEDRQVAKKYLGVAEHYHLKLEFTAEHPYNVRLYLTALLPEHDTTWYYVGPVGKDIEFMEDVAVDPTVPVGITWTLGSVFMDDDQTLYYFASLPEDPRVLEEFFGNWRKKLASILERCSKTPAENLANILKLWSTTPQHTR